MSKYIAKYIRIDEEVKIGSIAFSKWRSENKFTHHVTITGKDGDIWVTNAGRYRFEDLKYPVKLFLFKDDEQIAEVSSSAVWVKEMDTFDDDQIKIISYVIPKEDTDSLTKGQSYYCSNTIPDEDDEIEVTYWYYGDDLTEYVKSDKLIIAPTARILNPSCKHFH